MRPKRLPCSIKAMECWFRQATSEQCDTMSSMQLEYKFDGDHFGSVWWLAFQDLGFKHNGTHYQLPTDGPVNRKITTTTTTTDVGINNNNSSSSKKEEYTATQLYQILDSFAIPHLYSPFQEFPPSPAEQTIELLDWWQQIRDCLIFWKFNQEISKNVTQSSASSASASLSRSRLQMQIQKKRKRQCRKSLPSSSSSTTAVSGTINLFQNGKSSTKRNLTSVTENGTIEFPTFDTYARYIEAASSQHIEDVEERFVRFFQTWRFELSFNRSLLFYGVGSKRHLINQFVADQLRLHGDVLVLDGFDGEISIDGILDVIVGQWLRGVEPANDEYTNGRSGGITKSTSHGTAILQPQQHYHRFHQHQHPPLRGGKPSPVQRAVAISRALSRLVQATLRPFYLVIHNIDGKSLRTATCQTALANLTSHSITPRGFRGVRLVSSIDNVNGPTLLWENETNHNFNWMWKQVHTHLPYVEEVRETNPLDMFIKTSKKRKFTYEEEEEMTEESLFAVLESLAPRHAEALQELASLQLENTAANQATNNDDSAGDSRGGWVDYKVFYDECRRNKCIVSTDAQLRQFVKEFIDHGIVEKNPHAVMAYRIPFPERTLRKILNSFGR